MKNRKTPISWFAMGIVLNMVRTWYLGIAFVVLLLMKLLFSVIPLYIPLIVLFVWLLLAFKTQFSFRKNILSRSENEEYDDMLDKVFDKENPNWRESVMNSVNEIIKQHHDGSE